MGAIADREGALGLCGIALGMRRRTEVIGGAYRQRYLAPARSALTYRSGVTKTLFHLKREQTAVRLRSRECQLHLGICWRLGTIFQQRESEFSPSVGLFPVLDAQGRLRKPTDGVLNT